MTTAPFKYALVAALLLACSSTPQPTAADSATLARETSVRIVAATKAVLLELETCEKRLTSAGVIPPDKARDLAGYLMQVRLYVERAEQGATLATEEIRTLLDYAEAAVILSSEFGAPPPKSVLSAIELARAVVGP